MRVQMLRGRKLVHAIDADGYMTCMGGYHPVNLGNSRWRNEEETCSASHRP